MMLNYRDIISSSWSFTQQNKPLILWYSFLPSFLSTLVSIIYVVYQYFSFKNSSLFSDSHSESFLKKILMTSFEFFQKDSSLGLIFAGIIIFLALLYLFLPTLCQGGLIQLTARIQNNQKVRLIDGIYYGFISFLPLFEYHLLIRGFSLVAIFTELAFVARNLGIEWFHTFFGIFILIAVVGFVLLIFFTYTDYFIVIDKGYVFSSIVSSIKLVMRHWQETFLILIIMAIITLQIIIRLAIVILIPVIVTFSTGYFVTFTVLKNIGFIIGLALGFIALLFAAYLGGTIHVFATSVWVKTFLDLSKKEETSAREENVAMLKQSS